MIAIMIALLGILSYQVTHDVAISELLFLVLLCIGIVKLVPIALRLFAILTITLIFILVMLSWVGVVVGNG
jgi:hypothetical protein